MRKIDKPEDDPKDVYLTCISRVRNKALKDNFESVADDIEVAAEEYDRNAMNRNLYITEEHTDVAGVISRANMEKVYTDRMAKEKVPGRPVYDRLKSSAHHDICPFCGQRVVSQLDHYLPKAKFPALSVVPYNLVPSCGDCNKSKLTDVPNSEGEQTFHPYYDDVTTEQWLFAEVIEGEEAILRFYVEAPEEWEDSQKARAQTHFTTFGLGDLYASQAGAVLSDIRYQLEGLYEKAGVDAVREHLSESASSRYDNHINSWQTALYQAMRDSDWFCEGGFRNV